MQPPQTASPRARELIEEFDEFVARDVAPLENDVATIAEHERVRPDGRLSEPILAAKRETNRRSAKANLYALHLPEDLGGRGFGLVDLFHLQEHLFRRGYTLALDAMAHLEGPSANLQHLSPEVRDQYLSPLLAGDAWQCGAVTEPVSGGSDITAMRARAERIPGGWRLNAHKWLISYAPFAEFAQVYAVTDREAGSRSLTGFMVDASWPGFERGEVNRTLTDDGVTGEFFCRDVEVPDANLIGAEGEGLQVFLEWINWSRVRRGGQAVGLAWYCYDLAVRQATTRQLRGAPLGRLQAVQFRIVDMYADIMATRALVLQCLQDLDTAGGIWRLNPPGELVRQISLLKFYSEEMLFRVADSSMQILGGHGLLQSTGLEYVFRMARNLRVPGGNTELMRETVSKTLLPRELFE